MPVPSTSGKSLDPAWLRHFSLQLALEALPAAYNGVVSPYSVACALALAWAGAQGNTAAVFQEQLGRGTRVEEALASIGDAGATSMPPTPSPSGDSPHLLWQETWEFASAVRMWLQAPMQPSPSFCDRVGLLGDMPVAPADFKSDPEEERRKINSWVAGMTAGRIQDIVPRRAIRKQTRAVLANALYLKAGWRHEFPEHRSEPARFRTFTGPVDATLMRQERPLDYLEDEHRQALRIPLQGPFDAVFILPRGTDAAHLRTEWERLHSDGLRESLRDLSPAMVDTRLPRLRVGTSCDVTSRLQSLGLGPCFSPGADYSLLHPELNIADASCLHAAEIEVNEKGVTGAAATVLAVAAAGVGRRITLPERVFLADHPFLFLVVQRSSCIPLFMGNFTGAQAP